MANLNPIISIISAHLGIMLAVGLEACGLQLPVIRSTRGLASLRLP